MSSLAQARQDRLARYLTPLFAATVFFLGLLLFTHDHSHAFYYHPDESGKVRQVRKDFRNFNHPQLLLNSAALVAAVTSARSTPQQTVLAGRWTSAFYVAAGAALFTLALAWWITPLTGLAAGLLVIFTPLVYEAAHHFKEDSTFLFGFAVYTAALVALSRKPSRGTVLTTGAALALIASTKYVGILAVPLGFAFIFHTLHRHPLPGWPLRRALLSAGGVFALVFVLINYQILTALPDFAGSLGEELKKVQEQPAGITERIPHGYLWRAMLRETPALILIFAALGLFSPLFERRRSNSLETALILFPALYWLATSFSGKVALRYFDPLAAMIAVLAALGAGRTAILIDRCLPRMKGSRLAGTAFLTASTAAMLALNLPALRQMQADFQMDTRRDLVRFIQKNLPPSAIIAQDKQVKLPNASRPEENIDALVFEQTILPPAKSGPVADLGTLAELRTKGVTHVVVAESDWSTYFSAKQFTTGWESAGTDRRLTFYRDLFREGRRVWEAQAGKTAYVRQGLILFEIAPPR